MHSIHAGHSVPVMGHAEVGESIGSTLRLSLAGVLEDSCLLKCSMVVCPACFVSGLIPPSGDGSQLPGKLGVDRSDGFLLPMPILAASKLSGESLLLVLLLLVLVRVLMKPLFAGPQHNV